MKDSRADGVLERCRELFPTYKDNFVLWICVTAEATPIWSIAEVFRLKLREAEGRCVLCVRVNAIIILLWCVWLGFGLL